MARCTAEVPAVNCGTAATGPCLAVLPVEHDDRPNALRKLDRKQCQAGHQSLVRQVGVCGIHFRVVSDAHLLITLSIYPSRGSSRWPDWQPVRCHSRCGSCAGAGALPPI